MVSVFSFCLFGDTDKYCVGLLNNIKTIFEKFPGWMVYVYLGEGVPHWILSQLQRIPIVRIIETNVQGNENKAWRFFAVDLPEVDVCIVRDSDSRVYDRDQAAIQEFLQSDKEFHIIRDHPNHFHKIMAGMWGAKKGIFANTNMQELYTVWRQQRIVRRLTPDFWDDTTFLIEMIYPNVINYSFIHDTLHSFEPASMRTEIKAPIGDGLHFVGQVYEFDTSGNEYPKYTDYFNPQR